MARQDAEIELYDFLYLDKRRLTSLYAQLFSGLITSVTQTKSTQDTDSGDMSASVGVVKGSGGRATQVGESKTKIVEPRDEIFIELLSSLTASDFFARDISKASVGDLVLVSGTISLFDATNLHNFMDQMPTEVLVGDTKTRTQRKVQQKEMGKLKGIIRALYTMTSLGLQLKCLTPDGNTLWATIESDYLYDEVASLTLKHGFFPPGEWRIAAIVDALPDQEESEHAEWSESISAFSTMAEALRQSFGREDTEFGVTILAIFRHLNP